ncbi:unnamed protein product [Ambrosiozyma monospora]|uniref:Unnamed protein product n=1 Tax=Ambrosiozyma monospora TaxID=43982 RepID=A0ACB5SXI3_AMBMO|nr:unnamed protein product [Ambrosiozyma monospora]
MFEDHRFAIDPTNSEYKKTDVMDTILRESQAKLGNTKKNKKRHHDKVDESTDNDNLGSLVKKIKKKSKHH